MSRQMRTYDVLLEAFVMPHITPPQHSLGQQTWRSNCVPPSWRYPYCLGRRTCVRYITVPKSTPPQTILPLRFCSGAATLAASLNSSTWHLRTVPPGRSCKASYGILTGQDYSATFYSVLSPSFVRLLTSTDAKPMYPALTILRVPACSACT